MQIRVWTWVRVLLLAGVAGCGRSPGETAGTGAKEAAQGYYEALLRQDWAEAYGFLHADTRDRCSVEQFRRLADNYRRALGFEPQAVRLQTCDEKGSEAVARVAFTGQTKGRERRHRDAITLRRDGEKWGVILPAGFGTRR
jgi:hypothetical protein